MLACYNSGQVKVAEMPLDTCRMMQAIEWEDPAASARPFVWLPRPYESRFCIAILIAQHAHILNSLPHL